MIGFFVSVVTVNQSVLEAFVVSAIEMCLDFDRI